MGKICDPPSFTGGQSAGVIYKIAISWYRTSWQQEVFAVFGGENGSGAPSPPADSTIRNAGISVFGAISGISNRVYLGGDIWRVTIGGATVQFYVVDKGSDFRIYKILRADGQPDIGGDPPPTNCRCTPDSCRVDCAGAPDGFCCIDHALTNRLLLTLQN